MISIKGLNKFFNKGKSNEIHVLKDVDIQLPEKGMVALFGQSGCGKTTLLNVIGGLDRFDRGNITVHGENIKSAADVLRNRDIGYVFQNYNLNNNISCYDNVADALRLCGIRDENEIEHRVRVALSNVDMLNYKNRTPDTLSGGQQQRVAIARAIVKSPRIILADEPTGNLDEANTVMIMDMLKKISQKHLVVLVTHEADLVDYYSDSVIEMKDGKLVNVRSNEAANGYSARDKNRIYLGELEKNTLETENVEIEYFGDRPDTPLKLKIVNYNGKPYIRIDSPGVQIIDEYSEMKLNEGVYSHKEHEKNENDTADMTELPPIEGKNYGALFTFRSALKSGYISNFGKKKKSEKILRRCMCLFAAVLVIMSATFGTSISSLFDAHKSYNHNVFYVHTPDGNASQLLNEAVNDKTSGIDYTVLYSGGRQLGDSTVFFNTGAFETFMSWGTDFSANGVYLSSRLIRGKNVLAGQIDSLGYNDIVISSAVADTLLENSTLGYISDYNDLIGLICSNNAVAGKSMCIAGVVESDENAVYLSDIAIADQVLSVSTLMVELDLTTNHSTEPGKAIYYQSPNAITPEDKIPKIGDKIKIHGIELEVSEIVKLYTNYGEWLSAHNISKDSVEEYIQKNYPDTVDIHQSDKLLEAYEYYYSEIDTFIADYYNMRNDEIELWMAVEKNIALYKYIYTDPNYLIALELKERNGKAPSMKEVEENREILNELEAEANEYREQYWEEFYQMTFESFYENFYIVDELDYIAFSTQVGDTAPSASMKQYDSDVAYDVYVDYDYGYYDGYYMSEPEYMVVHSYDQAATEAWLNKNASYFPDIDKDFKGIVSPDDIFDNITELTIGAIFAKLTTQCIILLLLSLCMYFIMRSSMLGKIKEIGIYRAIGVSKKNLIFKSVIETSVLASLTVFIGYLISSLFIKCCFKLSPLISQVMYYPLWYALVNFVILIGICIICGVLPIIFLLTKTPSQILSKYDI